MSQCTERMVETACQCQLGTVSLISDNNYTSTSSVGWRKLQKSPPVGT